MKLTLGFSPCPNDTFIFDAMVNGKIDTRGLSFEYVMEDVETLNRWATEEKLDITKLSYNTFLHTAQQYALLHAGSALGQGVGPLLIANEMLTPEELAKGKIAIPGVKTTANLLLTLAMPQVQNKSEVLFSKIEDAVISGEYTAGLVIHESRFTYQSRGLKKIMDLGDWWEQTTNAPIPLGGIVARRRFDKELLQTIDAVVKDSVAWSWRQYPKLSSFITSNAQEMDEAVMRQHIELYVNDYTTDLGEKGRAAIATMFIKAKEAGIETVSETNIFY